LNAGQADAGVVYEFIQQGRTVVLNVSGSISSAPTTPAQGTVFGTLFKSGSLAMISPASINTSPLTEASGARAADPITSATVKQKPLRPIPVH
jgi:hypothetical protein